MKTLAKTLGLLVIAGMAFAVNPVTFQVHMNIQQQLGNFNPDTDQIVVRGDFNGWGGAAQALSNSGDMLYTGTFELGDELIGTTQGYKFVILPAGGADNWESMADNRSFVLAAGGQTLDPVYFNNQDSAGELTNVEVIFSVNMQVMAANGTFDPITDWIVLRGNHASLGNWGGAVIMNEDGGNPGHYYLSLQFDNVEVDSNLEYKFVILEDQNEASARWESVANRMIPITAGLPDNDTDGYGEIVLDEAWFDDVTWDDIISQDVTVHFAVSAWPIEAWFVEHPGETNQNLTSYADVTYIAICGPWNNWPWGIVPANFQLVNTTSTWFEADVLFSQFSSSRITYKYGANGEDNEAGFQQDHVQVISDENPTFNVVNTFGELGDLWDVVDVDPAAQLPGSLELGEAYPNPFNPVTTLSFANREAGQLRLSVVNLAGQEVAVLSQGWHSAGRHQVSFDAAGLASGLYVARLEGLGASQSQKLLLVK